MYNRRVPGHLMREMIAMDTPLSKTQVLDEMRAGLKRWELLLASTAADTLLLRPAGTAAQGLPRTVDTWSIKDVLAHLMLCQRTFLAAWTGTPDALLIGTLDDPDAHTAWLAHQREWPLAEVLKDWRAVHDLLYARVEAVTAREWERRVWARLPRAIVPPRAIRQGELWPLGSVVAEHACRHGQGHYLVVCAWLTARGDAEDSTGPRVGGESVGVPSPHLSLPEWSGHQTEAVH